MVYTCGMLSRVMTCAVSDACAGRTVSLACPTASNKMLAGFRSMCLRGFTVSQHSRLTQTLM